MAGFEEFVTAGTQIAPFFHTGRRAGTSMKTFLARLAAMPNTAREMVHEDPLLAPLRKGDESFSWYDANENLKTLPEIAELLKSTFAEMTAEQRGFYFSKLFGTDAIKVASALMASGAAGLEQTAASLALITAADVAATKIDNLIGEFDLLRGKVGTLATDLGEVPAENLKNSLIALNEFLDKFISDRQEEKEDRERQEKTRVIADKKIEERLKYQETYGDVITQGVYPGLFPPGSPFGPGLTREEQTLMAQTGIGERWEDLKEKNKDIPAMRLLMNAPGAKALYTGYWSRIIQQGVEQGFQLRPEAYTPATRVGRAPSRDSLFYEQQFEFDTQGRTWKDVDVDPITRGVQWLLGQAFKGTPHGELQQHMDYLSTRDAAWGHTPMDSESVRNRLGQVIFDETVARIQASSPVDIQVPKVTVPITVEIVGVDSRVDVQNLGSSASNEIIRRFPSLTNTTTIRVDASGLTRPEQARQNEQGRDNNSGGVSSSVRTPADIYDIGRTGLYYPYTN